MSLAWQTFVRDFHEKFGLTIGESVEFRDSSLRYGLIREEAAETMEAIAQQNMVAAVDGLCDLIYVCLGAAVSWGVDLTPLFREVHVSNMTKTGGGKNVAGKVMKGPDYEPPRIKELLIAQGWKE